MSHRPTQDGGVEFFDTAFQSIGNPFLEAREETEFSGVAVTFEMLQVAGEDEFGFDEGKDEDSPDDRWDLRGPDSRVTLNKH